MFCGLCYQHTGTVHCSCSICYRSIKQTRLIAQTQQQFDHTWECATFDLSMTSLRRTSFDRTSTAPTLCNRAPLSGGAAQSQGLRPFGDRPIFALCSLVLMPLFHNLRMPLEARGFTTGLGSMNCCVVLSQRTISEAPRSVWSVAHRREASWATSIIYSLI